MGPPEMPSYAPSDDKLAAWLSGEALVTINEVVPR